MGKAVIPEPSIMPFLPGDLDAVNSLEKLCFKDPYPSYFISQLAETNPDTFLVAVVDNNLVGYAVAEHRGGHNHLVSIAVHPILRRSGIGTRLLRALEERIEKRKAFRLEVRESNLPAIEFYREHGFHRTRVVRGYYSDGEDALLMEKLPIAL